MPPEESDGERHGGAETEAAEVRAKPAGQPDQRAGPPQENGGVWFSVEKTFSVMVNK